MNEQELNKKLAEWAGFQFIRVDLTPFHKKPDDYQTNYWYAFNHWVYPDGTKTKGNCPDFIQSLDACFRWLVPKYIAEICKLPMGLTSIMSIYAYLFAEWLKVMQDKVEPPLALCLAIEKLIDSQPNEIDPANAPFY